MPDISKQDNTSSLLAGESYYLRRYGCWMNDRDAETLAGILENCGARAAAEADEADILLFNTCSVSGVVETEVRRALAKVPKEKKIIVTGCYPQHAANDLREKFPQIDILLGAGKADRLPGMIREMRGGGKTVVDTEPPRMMPEGLPARRFSEVSSYVTIMNGCSDFCSYCIVPFVRGPAVSRSVDAIMDEAHGLVEAGCREITLVGHNVQSFRGGMDFTKLLRRVSETGIARVRFLTSNPADIKEETLELMAECPNICPSLHLPLQSGSDRVLRAMNRRYSVRDYIRIAERFRELMPEGALTTDIIVGYPGETEEDYRETLEVYRNLRFDGAYAFAYSPRPKTRAADAPDQIPDSEKIARFTKLLSLCAVQREERARKMLGSTQIVLVEKISGKNITGRTENGWPVTVSGGGLAPGDIITVRIQSVQGAELCGLLI